MAAASLGQVYKARLAATGDQVAVKVRILVGQFFGPYLDPIWRLSGTLSGPRFFKPAPNPLLPSPGPPAPLPHTTHASPWADPSPEQVQRPFVLETVSLDLHLGRQLGRFVRNFPAFSSRLDIVAILDQFAQNFYQELDYNLECQNGIKIAEDMKMLPMVVIPKVTNYNTLPSLASHSYTHHLAHILTTSHNPCTHHFTHICNCTLPPLACIDGPGALAL